MYTNTMYFISIGLNLLYNMINNAIIHSYSWCIHVLINASHLFFSATKFGCTFCSVWKSLELKTNISILKEETIGIVILNIEIKFAKLSVQTYICNVIYLMIYNL